jgi:hypothetical protein
MTFGFTEVDEGKSASSKEIYYISHGTHSEL